MIFISFNILIFLKYKEITGEKNSPTFTSGTINNYKIMKDLHDVLSYIRVLGKKITRPITGGVITFKLILLNGKKEFLTIYKVSKRKK